MKPTRSNRPRCLMSPWTVLLLALALLVPSVSCKKSSSQYLGDVNREEYAPADPPAAAPVFLWDFSGRDVYAYAYSQEAVNEIEMSGFPDQPGDMSQTISATAELAIQSRGNKTADVVLKIFKMDTTIDVDGESQRQSLEDLPPVIVQGLREDGYMPLMAGGDMLTRVLFPLPKEPIAVGKTVDVPIRMPLDASTGIQASMDVIGLSRITLSRYVKIKDRTCAQFDVDFEISSFKPPPDLQGDFDCFAEGESVFYFDVDARCFVSGTTALLVGVSMDIATPTMGGSPPPDMPDRVKMAMTTDNLIRVSLKE